MEENNPLHWDRHKAAFNFPLLAGLALAVISLLSGGDSAILFVIIGLALAAYGWFTQPSQYVVYADRLVVTYGKPRVRHIPFQEVDQVELLKIAIGDRLLVRLKTGRRMFLQPRDLNEFQLRFAGALDSYRGQHQEE